MPRVRRKAKARRLAVHDCRGLRYMLRHGTWFFPDEREQWNDDQFLAEAWWELREVVMAEHLAESPGTRPWAWWRFEAKAPWLVVHQPWPAIRLSDIPSYGDDDFHEPQAVYLERHGLLTAAERRAIEVNATQDA